MDPSDINQHNPSIEPVWISSVRLMDFRNYSTLSLAISHRHVVLTGANGSGKTNLLEAISFLSPGRGLRRVAYPEIAREGGPGHWAVSVQLESELGETALGTGLQPGPNGELQRRIRINNAPAKSSEALSEHVSILWLTPSMDTLFTGAASERRKWLDRMVLAIDKSHGSRVNAFEKAMRQRNRLLDESPHQTVWLDGLEAQMAEFAIAIATARAELVSLLEQSMSDLHAEQEAFPQASLALDGALEADAFSRPAIDSEEQYRRTLAQMRDVIEQRGEHWKAPIVPT